MTTARLALGAVLLLLTSLSACRRGLTEDERELVRIWLLCDDCSGGERQQVAALGSRAVPTLAVAMRDGPSAEGRANIEAQLRDLYGRLGPMTTTEPVFVATYLQNYISTWRTRAAYSLGDIADPTALAALRDALAADSAGTALLPDEARLAAHGGLATALPPFSGTLSDSAVAAFDTVTVRRGQAEWNGDEGVTIRGGPFSGGLLVHQSLDSLRFLAVAAPGSYVVTIDNEAGGPTRAPLRITSLRYDAQPPAVAAIPVSGPFPRTFFLALGYPPGRDTAEVYRFAAVQDELPVTATAEWAGRGNVDLRWRECLTVTPVGNESGATMDRPERTSVVVPDGACWLLVVTLRPEPGVAEIIKLSITPP